MYSKSKKQKILIKQQGAALVVSLVVLLIMTLLGVASLQTTTFEERMVGNIRDKQLAFEAAESGLRDAEAWLQVTLAENPIMITAFDGNGGDGLYNDAIQKIWGIVDWENIDSGNTNEARSANIVAGVPSSPKYVVQRYGETSWQTKKQYMKDNGYGQGKQSGSVHLFRITARGTGGSDNAVVVLQSTFGVLVN